jgi:uncharacterized surface protein with fasciclin (FAS1) repeats
MNYRLILILAASASLAAGCQQSDEANRSAGSTESTAANSSSGQVSKETLGKALEGSADHSSLAAAIKAAGLDATLNGSQAYTLLAPTNAAFEKLPDGAAEDLMKPESKGRLTALLTNHLVPGVITASDLSKAIDKGKGKTQLATMGGGTLNVAKEGDVLVVTDAKGGKARISGGERLQSNGVVHSIDGILSS